MYPLGDSEWYSLAAEIKKTGPYLTVGHSGGPDLAVIRYAPDKQIGVAVLANRNTTGISALLVDRILKRMLLDSAFDYQPRPVGMAILQRAARDSLGTMIRFYETARVNRSYDFSGDEDQLNSAGYEFMNGGNLAAAVRIFRLLVREHPHSANAFDSLGEACLKAGDNAGALENYRRSLELNPGNEHARKVIGQMTGK